MLNDKQKLVEKNIKLFKNFLSKELMEAQLNEFLTCLRNDKGNNATSLKQFCAVKNPNSYIFNAFTWGHTPSGHEFWKTINCKWEDTFKHRNDMKDNSNCKSIW